jgi:DNA-binding response OmpR family regulator
VESSRAFAEKRKVVLEFDPAPGAGKAVVDPDRLAQVMANLLSNAVKFSPEGGTVEVEMAMIDGLCRVSVRDHGAGIPVEFHSRIFQKFAQADSSDTRAQGGTGLGLSICKIIVEHMGGRIGFASEAGKGTTLHFDLPALAGELAQEDVRPGEGQRVLVLLPDEETGHFLKLLLSKDGYEADVVTDAGAALAALDKERYATLVIDLQAPTGEGKELVRRLKEDGREDDVPIIFLAAELNEGKAALNGATLAVADWLVKPVEEAKLGAALRRAVAMSSHDHPRILHVEDDPDIARLVALMLGDAAEIVSAQTLDEARRRIDGERFNLVILDVALPDGSGLDLLEPLSSSAGEPVPVLIFSASEMTEELTDRVAGALVKSRTSNEQLVATITNMLGNGAPPPAAG